MGGVLWLNYQTLGVDPLPSEHRFVHYTLPSIYYILHLPLSTVFFINSYSNDIFVHFEKDYNVLLHQIIEASFSLVEHNMTNVTENFAAQNEANNL